MDEQKYNLDFEKVVLGRGSTYVAKLLLEGNKINIYNADKAVVTGNKKDIFAKYTVKQEFHGKGNPLNGPQYPRHSDGIVKRTIRGMVNFKKAKGKSAFSNLTVYVGNEDNVKLEKLPTKLQVNELRKYIKIQDIALYLGAKW